MKKFMLPVSLGSLALVASSTYPGRGAGRLPGSPRDSVSLPPPGKALVAKLSGACGVAAANSADRGIVFAFCTRSR